MVARRRHKPNTAVGLLRRPRFASALSDKRRSPRFRSGFTLIELLIVVAIMALLVSILLPSLKKARRRARTIVCTSNIRALATASLTYASDDRHEQLVPVHPMVGRVRGDFGAYEYGGKSGMGEPAAGNDATTSRWGTANGHGPATRPLNAVLYKGGFVDYRNNPGPNQANWRSDHDLDLPAYRCPSDRGYAGFHMAVWRNSGLTSYDHYGTSYNVSLLWGSTGIGSNGGPLRLISGTPYLRPETLVPNPSNTLYYYENCGRFAWHINARDQGGTSPHLACTGGFNVPVSPPHSESLPAVGSWHGRPYRYVATFVDGHAGVIYMQGATRPAPRLNWYPRVYGQGDNTGTHDYWAYRCVTVRGPQWQIDVLPAQHIESGIPAEQADRVYTYGD